MSWGPTGGQQTIRAHSEKTQTITSMVLDLPLSGTFLNGVPLADLAWRQMMSVRNSVGWIITLNQSGLDVIRVVFSIP